MLSILFVALVPHGLQLAFLLCVLVDLRLQLTNQLLDLLLDLLDLCLLKVQLFALIVRRNVLAQLVAVHLADALLELGQLRLHQADLFATVALLLLELHRCVRIACHRVDGRRSLQACVLDGARDGQSCHGHVLRHRRVRLELIVDCLDDGCEARVWVPTLNCGSLVLDCHWVQRWVRHRRHHVDLRRHLREQIRQRHLDVERRWRDIQLEWDAMLLVGRVLPIQHRFRVHLAQLVDLDVRHRCVLGDLLSRLLRRHSLTCQHIIIHSTVL